MRWHSFALILSAVVLFSSGDRANACGDKLLVLGRGVRFQVLFGHPASILGYVDAGSPGSMLMRDPEFQVSLRKAGHKLQLISDMRALTQALESARYDVVLADISNVAALDEQVQSLPSNPVVLPIVYGGTKDDAKIAERKYHCVLKAPNKNSGYLSAIDLALEVKMKRDERKLQARK